MACDPDLVERFRELLAAEPGVSERRMFGGLAFLVDGNLAVSASSDGGALVRTGSDAVDRLLGSTTAEPAVMGRRTMRDWVRVRGEHLRTAEQAATWVRLGVDFARSLPPKQGGR